MLFLTTFPAHPMNQATLLLNELLLRLAMRRR
jgi:hypothetical protein